MKKICTLLLWTIPMALWSQALPSLHMNFQMPVPLGDFREASGPAVGYGANFGVYVRLLPTSPWKIGLQGGFFDRGSAKETLTLNIAGFQDDYEIRANNGVGNFGFLLQLEPWSHKWLSPYAEGEVGGNVFYSHVSFGSKDGDNTSITFDKRGDTRGRWGSFFGGSLGLKIALGKSHNSGIDLKCAYLKGGRVSYNAKPRFDDQGTVILERLRSTTDLLIPQIGFWVGMVWREQDAVPGRFSGN